MTKAEIVQALYDRLGGFSKKEAAELVDLVFELMKETLGRGEKIKVSGFGNFVLRDKRKRQGRNPQTGDPIEITERRVLNFKASQILKQVLNQDRPPARPVGDGAHDGLAANGAGAQHAAQASRSLNGNGLGSPSSSLPNGAYAAQAHAVQAHVAQAHMAQAHMAQRHVAQTHVAQTHVAMANVAQVSAHARAGSGMGQAMSAMGPGVTSAGVPKSPSSSSANVGTQLAASASNDGRNSAF